MTMPGPKGITEVSVAAKKLIEEPNLTTETAMKLAGFDMVQCKCRKLKKLVSQKKIRLLKAKKIYHHRRTQLLDKKGLPQVIGERMILQPVGSPQVALAATYLIVNPYLSVSIAMQSANFNGNDCRCKKMLKNVSKKKCRLIRALSTTSQHLIVKEKYYYSSVKVPGGWKPVSNIAKKY